MFVLQALTCSSWSCSYWAHLARTHVHQRMNGRTDCCCDAPSLARISVFTLAFRSPPPAHHTTLQETSICFLCVSSPLPNLPPATNRPRLPAPRPLVDFFPHCFRDIISKANLANNSIHSLPIDVEAAWGRPDAATGKLDPSTVGSPRTVEVLIRGNPIAEGKAEEGDAPPASGSAGAGNDGAMMDEAQ